MVNRSLSAVRAAVVAASLAWLPACAPDVSQQQGRPTSDTTTGTAQLQGTVKPLEGATAAWPVPPMIDTVSSAVLEFKAEPPPAGVKLPFPDAQVVKNITPGQRGGTFTYSSIGEPKTFNLITANENSSTQILGAMFAGLINFDYVTQTYNLGLLKEMVTENGNAAVWILRLRDGLKWSDGQPLTADDILFSNEVIQSDSVVSPSRDVLQVGGKPLKFEKLDNLTVRVTAAEPTGFMHVMMSSMPIVPKHALETAFIAKQFETAMLINADPSTIVCSGPFKLKAYQSGERTILERNPHYYRFDSNGTQLPYLDNVVFQIVPDTDAMLLRFEAGQADAISYPRMQDVFRLRDTQKQGNFTLFDCGPGESKTYLWLNLKPGTNKEGRHYVNPQKHELFKNLQFRKAVFHALNKDAIINTVLRGQALNSWAEISPVLTFWHNPAVEEYTFDQAKAKQILDQEQMIDRNGDGVRETADGTPLSLTFITNKGNKTREEIATLLAADLKEVGIQAVPQYIDFNTLVTRLNDTFDYEGCYLGFGGSIHPITSMNSWRSSGRTHFWNPLQETPATEWEAQIDQLCNEFTAALAPGEQQRIIHRMQEIVAQNVPNFPLFVSKTFHAVRNRFGNLRPSPLTEVFWNAEEIYVKQ